jgi:hypothetical protein
MRMIEVPEKQLGSTRQLAQMSCLRFGFRMAGKITRHVRPYLALDPYIMGA